MAAYGLYTHIQSNRRRSIALLVGLFFLVYLLVYAGALLGEALTIDAPPDELLRRALSEAYPDLKASQNFRELQSQLSDLENKIAAARRFFNNAVQEYNTGIQQFPAVLLAGPLGFTPKDFFDVGVDERKVLEQAPQVKF